MVRVFSGGRDGNPLASGAHLRVGLLDFHSRNARVCTPREKSERAKSIHAAGDVVRRKRALR